MCPPWDCQEQSSSGRSFLSIFLRRGTQRRVISSVLPGRFSVPLHWPISLMNVATVGQNGYVMLGSHPSHRQASSITCTSAFNTLANSWKPCDLASSCVSANILALTPQPHPEDDFDHAAQTVQYVLALPAFSLPRRESLHQNPYEARFAYGVVR